MSEEEEEEKKKENIIISFYNNKTEKGCRLRDRQYGGGASRQDKHSAGE